MPRRLIIGILVLLIVGVAGGAAVLVLNRLRQGVAPSTESPGVSGQLPGAASGGQQLTNPTGDDDGDGLSNADERVWGTNATNPDTDGDGFKDGAEVQARHNPTIPGPNDALPEGFEPGKNLTPLSGAGTQTPVDQLFASNLDLDLESKNYTSEYQARFAAEQRTPETLAQYVQEQTIVTKLPEPLARTIQVESSDSRQVLTEYLTTAGSLTAFSNTDVVRTAVNDLIANNDPASIRGLALQVRLHQERLLELRVPPSAATLQKLLLGYSELLAATYDVVAGYADDPVKSAVGLRQLQENDQTFIPLITTELGRMQQLVTTLPQ